MEHSELALPPPVTAHNWGYKMVTAQDKIENKAENKRSVIKGFHRTVAVTQIAAAA